MIRRKKTQDAASYVGRGKNLDHLRSPFLNVTDGRRRSFEGLSSYWITNGKICFYGLWRSSTEELNVDVS